MGRGQERRETKTLKKEDAKFFCFTESTDIPKYKIFSVSYIINYTHTYKHACLRTVTIRKLKLRSLFLSLYHFWDTHPYLLLTGLQLVINYVYFGLKFASQTINTNNIKIGYPKGLSPRLKWIGNIFYCIR